MINLVTIYSVTGQTVYVSNKALDKIDVSNFENGVYLIKFETAEQLVYKKLVKQ